jgi:hypothetical protein
VPKLGNVAVSEQKYQEIVGMLRNGQRETAITVVKAETGWGLKEASEYVDDVLPPSLGLPVPGEVTRPKGGGVVVTRQNDGEFIVGPSPKSEGLALVLCLLVGWCGAHCFYVGKVGTGVLYAFTMGPFLSLD